MPSPSDSSQSTTTSRPQRLIAHLDMDAFFASVELLRQPQLKGMPVVIGGGRRSGAWLEAGEFANTPPSEIPVSAFARLGGYAGRGVITTATYEAREFGVGSAMGLMKAARLCPQAILLPADFEEYRHYSRRFKSIAREIAPIMEDRGIDEIYLDFTHIPGAQHDNGHALARRIQQAILDATGLTCSIGIAPNKLLAKMTSEFHKPNGISVLLPEQLQTHIWPLACRKINGIGPKADTKLKAHGIHTIGELAQQAPDWLLTYFGKSYGAWLHAAAWGRDDRPLETSAEPVSISRETTFDRDLHAIKDRTELSQVFTHLCEKVAQDLRNKGYAGKTVGIKIKFQDFKTATRVQSLNTYTNDAGTIRKVAGECLKRVDLTRRFRLLGVKVDSLTRLEVQPFHAEPAHPTTSTGSSQKANNHQQIPLDFGSTTLPKDTP